VETRYGALGAYYDQLAGWTSAAALWGYGGGFASLTTHRALVDPRTGGRPTATRLHDIVAAGLRPLRNPRILDAGCGLGGMLIDLARRLGGRGVGITVSRAQARIAMRACERLGIADRVRVDVRSYDDPPAGPFDLIVAVESLAHSVDPMASLAALTAVVAPGGVLVVVDDMPRPEAGASADLDRFKRGWQCPVLWSADDYRRAFARLGLSCANDADLSAGCRPRRPAAIRRLERFNRLLYASVPLPAFRAVMDSYYGGLALERLYRAGLMEYRLLVGTRGPRSGGAGVPATG
jgi:SAM-dependent methyltransferase